LDRFPVPDDDERINKFKDREDGYYVFFQHVRKSGGTAFCSLAQKSMEAEYTNPDYCKSNSQYSSKSSSMTGMSVSGFLDPWTGALATYPYCDQDFFEKEILRSGYRYVPNEANPFIDTFFDYSGAVFATMFRDPMERWYSQYRFDYLEERYLRKEDLESNGPTKSFAEWYHTYENWFVCRNIYVNTFIGQVRCN
jgi:hypothetical protein